MLKNVILDQLRNGVRLDFQHFAVGDLAFQMPGTRDEVLVLNGTPDSRCSRATVPPLPGPAPLRALFTLRGVPGSGALQLSDGTSRPYTLVPEFRVDDNFDRSFIEWRGLFDSASTNAYENHYAQLERPLDAPPSSERLPRAVRVSAELLRKFPSSACLVKLSQIEDEFGQPFPWGPNPPRPGPAPPITHRGVAPQAFFEVFGARSRTPLLTADARVLHDPHEALIVGLTPAQVVSEVLPRLSQIIIVPPCPGLQSAARTGGGAPALATVCPQLCKIGLCVPWVRLGLTVLPRGPGGPRFVNVWAQTQRFKSFAQQFAGRCPKPPTTVTPGAITVVSDVRTADAELRFHRYQVDSAKFSARTVVTPDADGKSTTTTGLDPNPDTQRCSDGTSAPANCSLATNTTDGGRDVVSVKLGTTCPPHALFTGHLASPCWTGHFTLPRLPGTVQVTAVSKSTRPRVSLGAIFSGAVDVGTGVLNTSAAYGTFDRSGLRWFTRVPHDYVALGFAGDGFEYRGTLGTLREPMLLDWQHLCRACPSTDPSVTCPTMCNHFRP